MKTFSAKAQEIERRWWLIDAANQPLGKVAVAAARLLRGKGKPLFTPHVDCGDFVVVVNAREVALTGKKEEGKIYHRFSGYVGGHHERSAKDIRAKHPERLVESAVRGMIPHNRLGRQIYKKLKVYAGPDHQHAAQQPEALAL
jgi:large subunit ribosomal protein L13